jgi:hypothetical protein
MSRSGFRRRPSPATVIAVIALFAALGAGAYAASHLPKHSVGGHTIKKGAVRSRHIHDGGILGRDIGDRQVKTEKIHDGAVTTSKTSFISANSVTGSNSTTSTGPTDLGGPTVTVPVGSGAVVQVFTQADISVTGANTAKVDLFEPIRLAGAPTIMSSGSSAFQTRFSAPGSTDSDGVINPTRGGWITLAPPPGTYTFSLRYETTGGTATFQNRTLRVAVIR